MKYLIKLIWLMLILVSCNEKVKTPNETVKYTEDSFTQKRVLQSIDLPKGSNELAYPSKIFSFKNFLLIADRKSKKVLHVIDVNTEKYLGQFVENGKGPGEISEVRSLCPIGENSFMIFDPITQRILGYDIDSLTNDGKPLFEKKLKLSGLPHTFAKIDNSIFFTKQTDPSNRVFKINYNNTNNSKEDGFGKLPWIAKKGDSKITNANLCFANMKFKNNKLVFAYSMVPFLEIYDIDKNSWKSIVSPTEFLPEYSTPDGPYFAYLKNTLTSYTDLALTDNYIYALYSGETFLDENKIIRDKANKIFVYDYKGTPINEITLDTSLAHFTVIGNTVYGISKDDIKPKIVKFDLDI